MRFWSRLCSINLHSIREYHYSSIFGKLYCSHNSETVKCYNKSTYQWDIPSVDWDGRLLIHRFALRQQYLEYIWVS